MTPNTPRSGGRPPSPNTLAGVAVAIAAIGLPAISQAQAVATAPNDAGAPPPAASGANPSASADSLQQMQQELEALRREEAAAKAAERAREARIDALAQQLSRASGQPIVAAPIETVAASAAPGGTAPESTAAKKGGPSFEVYGFAQADYIQDFNRVNPSWDATLRPSRIPTTPGTYGSDGQSIISARQTRFGVQADHVLGGNHFRVKFDFDLFGVGVDEGQTTFRLRHAYGEWGPILAGQTESLFMDLDSFPNTIDYWGPSGMVFLRNPQVRFTYKKGPHEFAVAVEQPSNDVDPGRIREIDPALGNVQGDEHIPDFTAHYRYNGDWGHVQLAGLVRRVGYDTPGAPNNAPKGAQTGWGLNLTTNLNASRNDVIHLAVVYGEGIASYMNDGGVDLAPGGQIGSPQTVHAEAVKLLGVVGYIDHQWTPKFSSSIGYSRTQVDNTTLQSDSAFKIGQYASVNLLWTPVKNVMMGGEFLWGQRQDKNGATGDDSRIQLSFKYSFSSNDFLH